jgi:outer membrane protein assembly factor BamE (lipoprotein component of BamABCDE complex)
LTATAPRLKSAQILGTLGSRLDTIPPRLQNNRQSPRPWPALLAAALILTGCTISVDQRGNLPDPEKLAQVQPGSTTKEQVVKVLGTPSSASTFNDDTWYYISRKTKQVAFFSPTVLDQQVYIVDFDNRGVVKNVDHRNLADGLPVEPAPGATPAPGRELTFLEQLVGNLGKFNSSN